MSAGKRLTALAAGMGNVGRPEAAEAETPPISTPGAVAPAEATPPRPPTAAPRAPEPVPVPAVADSAAPKRGRPKTGRDRANRSFRANDAEYNRVVELETKARLAAPFSPIEARKIEVSLILRTAIHIAAKMPIEAFVTELLEVMESEADLERG